jgi:deazaflavin-dependent oxidoreductase (nitroreductase family)
MGFWRLFNPVARSLAGVAPWWVVLETTGRRSGRPRRVPLASGPRREGTVWLIAVLGESASFARNIAADPRVRVRIAGRWHEGTGSIVPLDPAVLSRFSLYARLGRRTFGTDSKLLKIELDDRSGTST